MKKQKKKDYLTYNDFYIHPTWILCKRLIKKANYSRCLKCNTRKNIQIDHIKPKSKYPRLIFDIYNMQHLCGDCNKEKYNIDETDYRSNEYIENLNKYLLENNIKYKRIKYSINIKKLLFKYPKGCAPKHIKATKKIVKRVDNRKMIVSRNTRYNNTAYKNEKLDPKLDISKILNLQASPGSE